MSCTSGRCMGSLMIPYGGEAPPKRLCGVPREPEEVKVQAKDFLQQYYGAMKLWVTETPMPLECDFIWQVAKEGSWRSCVKSSFIYDEVQFHEVNFLFGNFSEIYGNLRKSSDDTKEIVFDGTNFARRLINQAILTGSISWRGISLRSSPLIIYFLSAVKTVKPTSSVWKKWWRRSQTTEPMILRRKNWSLDAEWLGETPQDV